MSNKAQTLRHHRGQEGTEIRHPTILLKKYHQEAVSALVGINKLLNLQQSHTKASRGRIKTSLEAACCNRYHGGGGAPTHLAISAAETQEGWKVQLHFSIG